MPTTTSDCKKFLANFFGSNPQIINALYGGQNLNEIHEIQNFATNAKNWKRVYKCNPGNSDYCRDRYSIFRDQVRVNQYCEPVVPFTWPIDDFVSERGFRLEQMEDSVTFVVLEDKNGTLHLGDYIGD